MTEYTAGYFDSNRRGSELGADLCLRLHMCLPLQMLTNIGLIAVQLAC